MKDKLRGIKNTLKRVLVKAVYNVEKHFVHDVVEMDESKAYQILEQSDPRTHGSCITNNQIEDTRKYNLRIVVPAYNVENYIEECIDSVLKQKTEYKYQIYIVDDGSTDNTLSLLSKYKDYSNVLVIHKDNGGVASARNEGLKIVDADYVMFLDSDDYLPDNAIQVLLENAYSNDADIVEGAQIRKLADKDIKIAATDYVRLAKGPTELLGMPWAKVFKSKILDNICFPEKLWYEDTVCRFIMFEKAKKILLINDVVYMYRVLDNSLSHGKSKSIKNIDTYWILEMLMEDRSKLCLPFNDELLLMLERQIIINQTRIDCLDDNIQKSIFVLTGALLKKYYTDDKVLRSNCKALQLIVSGDYGGYKSYCKMKKYFI
ncbi:glycosyltransferase family 2 protein [Butyrivibrio sp. WCD3002]|uniref:glycosyltransferase family 2 protein n=1 Tax=Butyrivibrio sp. WCD3002 TaxID=1280676 RepID=UPI0004262092|nr:glycosyltransferase family 2 protein [Butyrivibrio sp. WCD3002]